MSDEYQSIPVAVARAAVQASGELEAIEGPQFLAHDEAEWQSYFVESQSAKGHPILARVIITRKGQKPREVVISWDEYAEQMDADPEWDALRASKPMSIFGAEVERHAYRVTFADVLAPLLAPAKIMAGVDGTVPPQPWAATQSPVTRGERPGRDWIAEVKAADAQKLNALYDEAREAGALAMVDGLQAAIMDRMLSLGDAPKPKPTGPRPQGQGNRRRRSKPKP